MNFRNEELLGKLERHPLKASLAKALDIAEDFRGAAEHITGNRDLSPQGRQKALQGKLRAAVRDLRDARAPLAEMQSKLAAKKAAVKQPAFDKTDVVGAMLRAELRTALRGMDPGQRAALLIGPGNDPKFTDAMLEQPQLLSGMSDNETFIVEAARKERLEGLYGPQLAEIDELETAVSEATGIVDLARVDLLQSSGMEAPAFEDFVKPIETKQNAPWLVRHNPSDPVVAVFPEKKGTAEFQRLATPDEIRDGVFFKSEAEYQASRAAA